MSVFDDEAARHESASLAARSMGGIVLGDGPLRRPLPSERIGDGVAKRNADVLARAEFLARAHHAQMGPCARAAGIIDGAVIASFDQMPEARQRQMILVMRELLDQGVIR